MVAVVLLKMQGLAPMQPFAHVCAQTQACGHGIMPWHCCIAVDEFFLALGTFHGPNPIIARVADASAFELFLFGGGLACRAGMLPCIGCLGVGSRAVTCCGGSIHASLPEEPVSILV